MSLEFPGSRWWKFDFHTHTPASIDYGKGDPSLKARSPRDWILDFMRGGFDGVVITDHNSGAWVDPLKNALAVLDQEKPVGYKPLVLFPGMEISVNPGIHLLVILDPNKTTADLDALRGAVGYKGTAGESDAVTDLTFEKVVEVVVSAGGIPIPAHVDDSHAGLFKLTGKALEQALGSKGLTAVEFKDIGSQRPQIFTDHSSKRVLSEIIGSDSHKPSEINRRFTWVKMTYPSLEGLRLGLFDGIHSIKRSTDTQDDPNVHSPIIIDQIEVKSAKYMGNGVPLTAKFNPWLNAIIGGRGTGKSTLMGFLRNEHATTGTPGGEILQRKRHG